MNDVYFSEIDSLLATWHSFIKVLIQLFSGISYDNAFASCMQLMIYMLRRQDPPKLDGQDP